MPSANYNSLNYLSGQNDTIAAISTPPGSGGIGIVRISGPGAYNIGLKLFQPASNNAVFQPQPRVMYLGYVYDPKHTELVDEVLWVFFRAPNSYTTQDLVEIHCHGGTYSTNRILELALENGARPALPGEFSCRAVLGGRIDIGQAEAICHIIEAKTNLEGKAGVSRLNDHDTSMIRQVVDSLTTLAAEIEAGIDFPDEVTMSPIQLLDILEDSHGILSNWLEDYLKSRIYFEGASVVICGKPNVGKSSLFNRLVGSERNLVSSQPGTTRDMVEAEVVIEGIRCKLIDTAGLGDAQSQLERMGMDIARKTIDKADLILEVLDIHYNKDGNQSKPYDIPSGKPTIHVLNKTDLLEPSHQSRPEEKASYTQISALYDEGIDRLKAQIAYKLRNQSDNLPQALHIFNRRQASEVDEALSSLVNCQHQLRRGHQALDICSMELQRAIYCLKRGMGLEFEDDVIEQVFRQFCVGK